MSTVAATTPRHAPSRPARVGDVVRSEWIKLSSVRSTWITVAVAVVLGVGLGILISHLAADHYATDLGERLTWDPTRVSLGALGLAQLALVVFGSIMVTGEYGTGSIRTSLVAVPRRGRLLAAKALVVVAVALVAGEVISFAAFELGQLAIGNEAPHATLATPAVLRAVGGAGLYLAAIALLSAGFGWLVRSTAAAISVMVGVLFVLPGVFLALPTSIAQPLSEYWPTNAGGRVFAVHAEAHQLAAWPGFGVLIGFTALILAAGAWALSARDA